MKELSALVYDCEILKCLPPVSNNELNYCAGWQDFPNMGISCICCYDLLERRSRVFLQDNLCDFQALAASRTHIIGFNSLSFDDNLCAANKIEVHTTYDLLVEVRRASGQPLQYTPGITRKGYNLDSLAAYNLGVAKSGDGALAPELWQRGHIGAVIDYCLTDVWLTLRLFAFSQLGRLRDPTDGVTLEMKPLEI